MEKDAAVAVRGAMGSAVGVRRAIGLTALVMTADLWRRDREAVQRLRLKADMVELAWAVPDDVNAALEERDGSYYALLRTWMAFGKILEQSRVPPGLQNSGHGRWAAVNRGSTIRGLNISALLNAVRALQSFQGQTSQHILAESSESIDV